MYWVCYVGYYTANENYFDLYKWYLPVVALTIVSILNIIRLVARLIGDMLLTVYEQNAPKLMYGPNTPLLAAYKPNFIIFSFYLL